MQYGTLDQFIRNPNNLRINLEYETLKEAIRALGGVVEPILVLEQLDGRFLILEGNRRHFALETLLDDPDYTGETKIPYIVLKELDEMTQWQYQLSLGSISKKLKPVEYWSGINKQIDLLIHMAQQGDERYKKLLYAENARMLALPIIAEATGVSRQWLYLCHSVFNCNCEFLLELLETNQITITTADYAINYSKKEAIDLNTLLQKAVATASEHGKTKLTEKFVSLAVQDLTDKKSDLNEKDTLIEKIFPDGMKPDLLEKLELVSSEIDRDNISANHLFKLHRLLAKISKDL
jgi:hypothetical protein